MVVSTARRFQGAWLTAIFGGITLDLPAEDAPRLHVDAVRVFGGIEIKREK